MSGKKLTIFFCLFTIWLIIMHTFESGFAFKINYHTKRRDDNFMRKIYPFIEPLNLMSTPKPGFSTTNRPMNLPIENQMRQLIRCFINLTELLRRNTESSSFRQPRSLWNETNRLQPKIMFNKIPMIGFNSTQFQEKIMKFRLFLSNLKKNFEEKFNLKNRTTIIPTYRPTDGMFTMPPFPSTRPNRFTSSSFNPYSSTIQPTVTYPWQQSANNNNMTDYTNTWRPTMTTTAF